MLTVKLGILLVFLTKMKSYSESTKYKMGKVKSLVDDALVLP